MKNDDVSEPPIPEEFSNALRALLADLETHMDDSLGDGPAEAVKSLQAQLEAVRGRFFAFYAEKKASSPDEKRKVFSDAKNVDEFSCTNTYPSLEVAFGTGILFGLVLGRPLK